MTTDERLEKVEGQLARVRWVNRCLVGCIVLFLGVWFILKTFASETAWAQSGAKEIRAKVFVLEDENGKMRASLGMHLGGPNLVLYDENGGPRGALVVDKNGPRLLLSDNNKVRVEMVMDKDGPRLSLWDGNGNVRVGLSIKAGGQGLALWDQHGKVVWRAP